MISAPNLSNFKLASGTTKLATTRTNETVDAEIDGFYTGANISQGNSMRRVIVRRSSVHGKGVFAVRPLESGERVLEYKGQIMGWRAAVRRHRREGVAGHTFLFGLSDGRVIDGNHGGNSARWLNHACAPNCETIEDAGRIFIHTLRPIEAGEELFIEYRLATDDPPDEDVRAQYACRCAAPGCRQSMLADAA